MGIRDIILQHKTEPPQLFVLFRGSTVFAIIWLSLSRYYNRKAYQQLFVRDASLPADDSIFGIMRLLPAVWVCFYHCRMAMFALMFLPNRSVYKILFCAFGDFGSIVAFYYPIAVIPFPHIVFIIGHLALWSVWFIFSDIIALSL